MLESPVRSRWTVIAGGLVVQIILGTVYAFSVFVRPLEEQLGWSRASTQWAFSVALATFALVTIPAVFNAIGRIFWGRVSDTIDRPRAMMLMYLGQGLAFMILAGIESPLAVFLASAWVGLNFGGNFALFPSATADYFGTKNFGVNYGLIFTAYGVAGILGPVVGGVLYDVTRDYVIAFVFAGVLCFLAAASAVVVWALSRRPVEYRASHA